ncbi:hypothetical protein M0812_11036 [Anaeramoeba flamelloides]|uniref:PAS domain-containing protein n=1 Tax=Anaeramoeba flamelloides TaxID=1746091 RepID=A0AAV7ZT38_9EUKA|nr:hypothetical protein M0812_11036 [Anaeramoeba flamelloides]
MGNANTHTTLSQTSWRKYKKMISKSKEAILLIDDKTNFTFVNRAALTMLNIKKAKDIKITPALISPLRQEHLGVDSKSGSEAVVKRVYESKNGKIDFVWQHQKITGELFYVRVYLTLVKVENKINCQTIWRKVDGPNDTNSSMGSIDPRFVDIDVSAFDSEYDKSSITKSNNSNKEKSSRKVKEGISTKKPNESEIKSYTSDFIIDVDQVDIDEEFVNFQDNVKNIVRSTNDSNAEKKIIQEFIDFEKVFYQSIESRDKYIKSLSEKNRKSKGDSRRKYRDLETHLQETLKKYTKEKEVREKIELENRKMKKKLEEVKTIFRKQKKMTKKITSIFENESNEEK